MLRYLGYRAVRHQIMSSEQPEWIQSLSNNSHWTLLAFSLYFFLNWVWGASDEISHFISSHLCAPLNANDQLWGQTAAYKKVQSFTVCGAKEAENTSVRWHVDTLHAHATHCIPHRRIAFAQDSCASILTRSNRTALADTQLKPWQSLQHVSQMVLPVDFLFT